MKGLSVTYKTLIYLISTMLFTILGLLYGKRKKIQQINDPNFMQPPTMIDNSVTIHEEVDNNDDNDLYEDSHVVDVDHEHVRDGAPNAARPLIEL